MKPPTFLSDATRPCVSGGKPCPPAFDLIPLEPSHVEDAAGVLVRSFTDDPGLRLILPNSANRARLGPSLARAVLRYALRCGAPLVTPEVVRGVDLWFPPEAPAPTDDDLAETGLAAIPEQIGPEA